MEKIRLGIIGGGWIANEFCSHLKTPEIALSGVCTRHMKGAEEFAAKYGIPFSTDSVDDLLGRDDIDAVYIATTNETHCEMAIKALNAGKHTLVVSL